MTSFSINKVYNFNTLAPDILGDRYEDFKVLAMMTADEAMKYRDIYTLHQNLVPVITGLPVNAGDCVFMLLENKDGETTVLAIEYIDPVSVRLVTTINIRVELLDVSTDDLAIVTARFKELGYTNMVINTF